jgi:hypothetical protein
MSALSSVTENLVSMLTFFLLLLLQFLRIEGLLWLFRCLRLALIGAGRLFARLLCAGSFGFGGLGFFLLSLSSSWGLGSRELQLS